MRRISVLGAGAWGHAIASALRASGTLVRLWGRRPAECVSSSLEEVLNFSRCIIVAVPAQEVRSVLIALDAFPLELCVMASKGLEHKSAQFMSEIGEEILPYCAMGALGGPNLAAEVEKGWPCGISMAAKDSITLMKILSFFKEGPFLLEPTLDLMGLQALSVFKNIMAIGYGLLYQAGLGENLLATFLVLALQESQRFSCALGGHPETALGFAGLGDLILTCTSPHSRNSQFGRFFPNPSSNLVEGVKSLAAVQARAKTVHLSLPLVQGIADILHGHTSLTQWPAKLAQMHQANMKKQIDG